MSAIAWATALWAPTRVRLRLPLDGLAGGASRKFCKEQLSGVAGIETRDDLIGQLPDYLDTGTRAQYETYNAWVRDLPPESRSAGFYLLDQGERLRRVFVAEHGGRPEECDLTAWDVARAVQYLGLAVGAGIIAEGEAWRWIAVAARQAQRAYRSWAEFGRGFLYGRWFWVGYWDDGMKDAEKAVTQLLADGGGWAQLAWDTDLAELDALAVVEEAPVAAKEEGALEAVAVRPFVDCPACQMPVLMTSAREEALCLACGEKSAVAGRDAWGNAFGLLPGEEDDEDDEDEEDEEEDASPANDVDLQTNLDDRIQRTLSRAGVKVACACGVAIDVARGTQRCACGRTTRVEAAPAWMRAAHPRVRYLVGGPIAIGDPDSFLTLVYRGKP